MESIQEGRTRVPEPGCNPREGLLPGHHQPDLCQWWGSEETRSGRSQRSYPSPVPRNVQGNIKPNIMNNKIYRITLKLKKSPQSIKMTFPYST